MTSSSEWALAVLRPLSRLHQTDFDQVRGFLMSDAEAVLGGLSDASAVLIALMAEGLVHCTAIVSSGEVISLYCLSDEMNGS